MLLYIFYVLLPIFTLIYFTFKKHGKKHAKEFPKPPGVPFIGHAAELRSTTNILNAFSKFIRNYGKTVKLTVGPVTGLVTADYKLIEFLLNTNKNLTKSQNYLYLVPWLGYEGSLLISDGGLKWKKHRKILTPAFHFEILKKFVGTFENVGNVLIERLSGYDDSCVDLYPLTALCTLDMICEAAMGTQINAQKDENSEYVRSVKEMCRITTSRCLSPLKIYNWTFVFTKDYFIQRKIVKILQNFSTQVIYKRKKELNKNLNGVKRMALLDLMIKFSEEGNLLSDSEIRDQVNTFMFAGHDTTASGICFALFLLANHPEIQDKVLKEQLDIYGSEDSSCVTYQNLQDMKYLDLVIKETLRLYPPVPIIGRYTTEDIEFDGYFIPKHTNIAVYVYELHRNPEFFPEPEKFYPDRFLNFDSSHPYAYIPFSAGLRNCIGQKFAMLEMKSIISKIVRHFELLPSNPEHKLVLAAEAVLKSVTGVKLLIKRRK